MKQAVQWLTKSYFAEAEANHQMSQSKMTKSRIKYWSNSQWMKISILMLLSIASQTSFAVQPPLSQVSDQFNNEEKQYKLALAENQNNVADTYDNRYSSYQFDDSIDTINNSLWDRIRVGFSMPDVNSSNTDKHEQFYASRPDYVARMLERSKKYLFHIVEEVENRGMPLEIALLPMVESAFNPKAMSSSKASGIWQFMPATGKDFGLKQNYWSDSRRDVTSATSAALTYLQRLHGMFGSWDLALAAYNAGEGTVSRAIEKNRRLGLPTDYEHLSLPDETRNYVPKLQAIKNIVLNPEQFGLSLNHIPNAPYFTTVKAPKQIDAKLAADLAGISQDEFHALNPSFNRPVIVANTDMHQLLLPTEAAAKFVNNLANYGKPLSNWQIYKPKRGERIESIAQRFNISLSDLRAVNNLSSHSKTSLRRALLVPTSGKSADDASDSLDNEDQDFENMDQLAEVFDEEVKPLRQTTIRYKVRKGDNLVSLAKRYGMPVRSVMTLNHLRNKKISLGQTLVFKKTISGKSRSGKLRSGKSKSSKLKASRGHGKRLGHKSKSKHKMTLKKNGKHHKVKASAKKSRFKAKHRR